MLSFGDALFGRVRDRTTICQGNETVLLNAIHPSQRKHPLRDACTRTRPVFRRAPLTGEDPA